MKSFQILSKENVYNAGYQKRICREIGNSFFVFVNRTRATNICHHCLRCKLKTSYELEYVFAIYLFMNVLKIVARRHF